MSEKLLINQLRVQGQGIPWTTWGVVTKHSPESVKGETYFDNGYNHLFTGDFVEVLTQNKVNEQEILLRFYIKIADATKAQVDSLLISETELVPVNKDLQKAHDKRQKEKADEKAEAEEKAKK